jgi:sugar phosphate isomerase/epimerase
MEPVVKESPPRYTRRSILALAAAANAAAAPQPQRQAHLTWRPKLGAIIRFSENNLDFCRRAGFTSVQLSVGYNGLEPDITDEQIARISDVIARSGLYVSSLGLGGNHIAPDPGVRSRANESMVRLIELAGKLKVPFIGTESGAMPGRPLEEQVNEIVRVYTEKYFPACQKHKVRLLWEPYPGGPNIATGPVGFEALFKAFGEPSYVGLQYDPSHLVWQMMDPIQCARDFVDHIYDVHLKDTEILWPALRRVGIQPLNRARWWRFRLPGSGSIDWKAFFTVLMEAGYQGAMNIESEDHFYYPDYSGADLTGQCKEGLLVTSRYLRQYVPLDWTSDLPRG